MIPTIRSLLGTLPQAFFRSICAPYCQTASQSLVAPVPPLHFIANLSWEEIYVIRRAIASLVMVLDSRMDTFQRHYYATLCYLEQNEWNLYFK